MGKHKSQNNYVEHAYINSIRKKYILCKHIQKDIWKNMQQIVSSYAQGVT